MGLRLVGGVDEVDPVGIIGGAEPDISDHREGGCEKVARGRALTWRGVVGDGQTGSAQLHRVVIRFPGSRIGLNSCSTTRYVPEVVRVIASGLEINTDIRSVDKITRISPYQRCQQAQLLYLYHFDCPHILPCICFNISKELARVLSLV